MYSVLIPTYNYNVTELVIELHRQAKELSLEFEIIILEDGSVEWVEENRKLDTLQGCKYIQLSSNIGRSAARNRLAEEARFYYLIFMDCDAIVQHDDYLQRYANFFREQSVVVIGGTAYDESINDPRYSLRLTYGRKREANLLYHNREDKYSNFATFNFLITKDIFSQLKFDESIDGYGHEDTVFGHSLHEAGYTFFRIDNTLLHQGLDDNLTFIRKTEESVVNLYRLYTTGKYPYLEKESKLLHSYLQLQQKNLVRLVSLAGRLLKPFLRWQLCSRTPSLVLYDVYKLTYLCRTATAN